MPRKHKPAPQSAKRGKFSEYLEGILAQIRDGFIAELKMEPGRARQAAEIAVEMIRENAGGGILYIAKGHLWAVTERHRTIYRRFNGHNHYELSQEFGLSERQIYTIVERCQQEEFGKKQMTLFDQQDEQEG